MTARTTNQAGDYANPLIWTPNGKPVAGDTATANHAVDITTTEEVGTSGIAGTVALTVNAAVTIKPSGKLTYRGDIVIGNAPFEVQSTGILEHSASLSAAPSTTIYKIIGGSANNQPNSYFVMSGVAGARSIWRSVAGGAHTWMSDGGWTRGGKAKLQWASLLRIGDGTNHSLNFDLNSSSADQFYMDHVNCDDCAGINAVANLIDGTTFRLLNVTYTNSGANLVTHVITNDVQTTGERSIAGCIFDTQPQFYGPNYTFGAANQFRAGVDVTAAWKAWAGSTLIRLSGGATQATTARIYDVFCFYDDPALANPHFFAPDGSLPAHDIDSVVFYFNGADEQGDCIIAPSPGAAATYGIYRCIVMPNASGLQSGTLLSCLGNANVHFIIEHNTARVSNWCISVGEGLGFAGIIRRLKGNIFRGTGTLGTKIQDVDNTGVVDMVAAADADFNCGYGLAQGRKRLGYDANMNGQPGINDIEESPRLFDETRTPATWDAMLGGPGTSSNALAELAKANDDSGYNSAYSVAALLAYLREGMTPLNAKLWQGAHDVTTVGAVQHASLTQRSILPAALR